MIVFDVALGGIQSGVAGLVVTAHNIANVNTEGFRSRRFEPGTRQVPDAGPTFMLNDAGDDVADATSDADLAREFINLKRHGTSIRANCTTLRMADRLERRMLDVVA